MTIPDAELWDPDRAIELAEHALELDEARTATRTTLAMAFYRAELYEDAIDMLHEAMDWNRGGTEADWFFLAMALAQTGRPEEARDWFGRAAQAMELRDPLVRVLEQFHKEAQEVLGIDHPR